MVQNKHKKIITSRNTKEKKCMARKQNEKLFAITNEQKQLLIQIAKIKGVTLEEITSELIEKYIIENANLLVKKIEELEQKTETKNNYD